MNNAHYLALALVVLLTVACSKQTSTPIPVDEHINSLVIIKSTITQKENEGKKESEGKKENKDKKQPENSNHRQLGAHVHGAASMNVILEKDQLYITMSIPGMDAVGFEHAAATEQDQEKLIHVLQQLQKPHTLFLIPENAQCALNKGEIETALLNKQTETNAHADIDISYEWTCKNSPGLKAFSVGVFKIFPHLQKINANWITGNKQGALSLTPIDILLTME